MNNPDYNNRPMIQTGPKYITFNLDSEASGLEDMSTTDSIPFHCQFQFQSRLIHHCFKQRVYSLIWHGEQGRKRLHERRGYREEITANSSPACCQLITGRVVKLVAALCAWGVCKWASYTLRVACVATAAACWSMPSALHLLAGRDR